MNQKTEAEITLPSLNLSQVLEKIILCGIVFILAMPLLGDYGIWLFPLGRDVIFKLTVELLWILFLVKILLSPSRKHEIRSTKQIRISNLIILSLTSFWLIMVLSTLNSVQPEFSVWGNIYKNQGLMTWTHYILFFFLLITFLRDKKRWQFLVNITIFVATLVGLIALWQAMQNGFDSRPASTLSNSNYLATYLVLLLPISFALAIQKRSILYTLPPILQFFALIFTQTRGGYLGIVVAFLIFSFFYLGKRKSHENVPKFSISNFPAFAQACLPAGRASAGRHFPNKLLIAALVLLITSYVLLITTSAGQSFQQKLPDSTDRFLDAESVSNSFAPRLEAWRAGGGGMLARPFLGYGPENFFVAFDEYYSGSQDHLGSLAEEGSLSESWFDKAHNFIFDIGATVGFLGLFAYISIFASAAWVLFRHLRIWNLESRILNVGLISALTGYLAQNLLGFDTIVPGIYLMFLLAYAMFLAREPTVRTLCPIPHTLYRISLSFGIIALVILFAFSLNIYLDILRANHQLNLAESLAQNIGVEQAFIAFEKGLEYNAPPVNPNLRRRYAVIALAYYDAVEKQCDVNGGGSDLPAEALAKAGPARLDCGTLFTDSKKYLARALELQLKNAETEWPRFTRNYIYAAQISHILADYENSDLYFAKALELSPGRTSITAEWNRLKKLRNE